MESSIKVFCRFRPLQQQEIELGASTIHSVVNSRTVQVKEIKNQKSSTHAFQFDWVFDVDSTQEEVYKMSGKPIIQTVLQGFNGTILAYGQTSSGKTHTMLGHQDKGIIPRTMDYLFDQIGRSPPHLQFRIKLSVVQIYNQRLRDLLDLSKGELKIRQDIKKKVFIEQLTQRYVCDEDQVEQSMKVALSNRSVGSTNINQRSSRSHMIMIVHVSQTNLKNGSTKSGKLYLVDLAGSQRVSKTGAVGQQLGQAKKINASLVSLGKVINALIDNKSSHIPYRDSKLTRILQQSLGGNSKTLLIVTCSPHPFNGSETVSTLRFGISAKNVKNKIKVNKELTVQEMTILLQKKQKQTLLLQNNLKRLSEFITKELRAELPELAKKLVDQRLQTEPDKDQQQKLQKEDRQSKAPQLQAEDSLLVHYQTSAHILKMDNERLLQENRVLREENQRLLFQQSHLHSRIRKLENQREEQDKLMRQTLKDSFQRKQQAEILQLKRNLISQKNRANQAQDNLEKLQKNVRNKLKITQKNTRALADDYYQFSKTLAQWKIRSCILQKKYSELLKQHQEVMQQCEALREQLNFGLEEQNWQEPKESRKSNIVKTIKGGTRMKKN